MSTGSAIEQQFRAAIQYSQSGQHEQAINELQLLLNQTEYPQARFLLAAEYAEIGQIEKGIEEMTHVVNQTPDFVIARFQLGLMHLTNQQPEQAEAIWQPLDDLADMEPIKLFKQGLVALTKNQFADALAKLQTGIELNTHNPPLNQDMQRVIDDIQKEMHRQAKLKLERERQAQEQKPIAPNIDIPGQPPKN